MHTACKSEISKWKFQTFEYYRKFNTNNKYGTVILVQQQRLACQQKQITQKSRKPYEPYCNAIIPTGAFGSRTVQM